MERGLIYRIVLVAALVAVSAVLLVPTIYYDYDQGESTLPEWWQKTPGLPQESLNLGLDLRGGMDLVVSVDVEQAVINELKHYQESMIDNFQEQKINYSGLQLDLDRKMIEVTFTDDQARLDGVEVMRKNFSALILREGKGQLVQAYALKDEVAADIRKRTVDQIKNIVARRIDAFGLKEPEIARQGLNRIRLQLPGAKETQRIKEIITRTAVLDFMIVKGNPGEPKTPDSTAPAGTVEVTWKSPTERDAQAIVCYFPASAGLNPGPVPANTRLALGKETAEGLERELCYLLDENLAVSGSDLTDARAGYSSERLGGGSLVYFNLNMKGARKFKKITGEHMGERLAIVLEGKVESAPNIRGAIFNRGQIEGNFTNQEAANLSMVLKSGSLTVPIRIEEERTVGASLGADSIRKGETAIFWGFVVVVVFMVIYYSTGGLVANLALILNLLFILAALALFGATLTLPGLAGIVLTVGMAVDANVLIFERIREEIRTGKTPQASVDSGYDKALWTILDANITTLIAALVLLQWGTGPIKGFAITLAMGIISSLFTAIVVTHMVYDIYFHYRKRGTLSVGIKLEPASAGGK